VRVEGRDVREHAADGERRRELVRREVAVEGRQRLELPHPQHGADDRHGHRKHARRELAAHLLAALREPRGRERARERAVRVRALEQPAEHDVLRDVDHEHHAALQLRVRERRERHGRRVVGAQRRAQPRREARVRAREQQREREEQD